MPWVVRDAVDEINRAAGRRWQRLDRPLPPRAERDGEPASVGQALVRHLQGYRPLWTGWEVRPAASPR
ncbi:MAG: hypothetical protein ACRDPF_28820 [Streptosporangiaceae bacterium]